MQSRLPAVILCFAISILGGCSAGKDEIAVLAPVKAMFDGMAHRDEAAIKATWMPGGVLVLTREGDLSLITMEYFAHRVATSGPTRIEERIHDPKVRIDHDLAFVWAPFDFYRDGKLDHCGRDLFSLIRKGSGWQIASLTATVRRDCAAN